MYKVSILTLTLVARELVWTKARVSMSDCAISDACAVAVAIMITTGVENWKIYVLMGLKILK